MPAGRDRFAVAAALLVLLTSCSESPTAPRQPSPSRREPPPTPGPMGPFRLDGSVVDGPFTVPGVTVTVVSGVGQGLTTRSSASGFFTLDGVAGRIELRLQKEGYPDAVSEIAMNANRRQSFPIGRGVPRPDYGGNYTLTIAASPSCASSLPEAARVRAYAAHVVVTAADGSGALEVTLADADFVRTQNGVANMFRGLADPSGGLIFSIGISDVFYEWHINDLVERLGGQSLVLNGMAIATGDRERISGTLEGAVQIAENALPPWTYVSTCKASDHRFEMVSR